MQEAALGRLDDAAIQLDIAGPRCSPAVEKGAQERGLAHAGNPVEANDSRSALHAFLEGTQLELAPDEGPDS